MLLLDWNGWFRVTDSNNPLSLSTLATQTALCLSMSAAISWWEGNIHCLLHSLLVISMTLYHDWFSVLIKVGTVISMNSSSQMMKDGTPQLTPVVQAVQSPCTIFFGNDHKPWTHCAIKETGAITNILNHQYVTPVCQTIISVSKHCCVSLICVTHQVLPSLIG